MGLYIWQNLENCTPKYVQFIWHQFYHDTAFWKIRKAPLDFKNYFFEFLDYRYMGREKSKNNFSSCQGD